MPTVTLFTEAFAGLAEAVSLGRQMPQLRRIIVPHPLNDRPEPQIRQVVSERIEAIVGQLTVS